MQVCCGRIVVRSCARLPFKKYCLGGEATGGPIGFPNGGAYVISGARVGAVLTNKIGAAALSFFGFGHN